ncbi:MAG: indolepyruvate ferredoxin oxidoreductase family protein, partial [Burkholderiales bacterium]|nr:indolepyruvate ferredoxin oxidoreductase family protein [Burkholderiales bacterium]
AAKYRALVGRVRAAERPLGSTLLTEAVARGYAKLLAYKDEYEVARLHARPEFRASLDAAFEGGYRVRFHLAPPLLARRDPATGVPRKIAFGPWIAPVLRLLARLKVLRGTALDPFGRSAERRAERALVAGYEALVEELLARLAPERHALAVELAALPEAIRGYGHVKAAAIAAAKRREAELLAELRAPSAKAA